MEGARPERGWSLFKEFHYTPGKQPDVPNSFVAAALCFSKWRTDAIKDRRYKRHSSESEQYSYTHTVTYMLLIFNVCLFACSVTTSFAAMFAFLLHPVYSLRMQHNNENTERNSVTNFNKVNQGMFNPLRSPVGQTWAVVSNLIRG